MIKTSNKATAADSKKRNVPHINCHHSQEIWSIGITGAPDRYGLNLRMVKHQNSLKRKRAVLRVLKASDKHSPLCLLYLKSRNPSKPILSSMLIQDVQCPALEPWLWESQGIHFSPI